MFVAWILVLFYAVSRLTQARDSEAEYEQRRISAIDERLADTGKAQAELRGLIDGLIGAIQETRLGMTSLGSMVRKRSTQEQIAYIIDNDLASNKAGALDNLSFVPIDATMLVVVLTTNGEVQILHPADLSETTSGPAIEALANVFELGEPSIHRKAYLLRVDDQYRLRLPNRLKSTQAAIVAPLLDGTARGVGALIMCSSTPEILKLESDQRRRMQARVVNIAEQVAPLVCSWREEYSKYPAVQG